MYLQLKFLPMSSSGIATLKSSSVSLKYYFRADDMGTTSSTDRKALKKVKKNLKDRSIGISICLKQFILLNTYLWNWFCAYSQNLFSFFFFNF